MKFGVFLFGRWLTVTYGPDADTVRQTLIEEGFHPCVTVYASL